VHEIDYSPSAEFLRSFFGLTTTQAVEIRALPNVHGDGPVRPRFTRDAEIIVDHLTRWDLPERAVYFGVATRLLGRPTGGRADLAELPALWVDIDCYKAGISKEDAVAAALSLPLRPSLVVDSGGGVHCYWLLSEAININLMQTAGSADELRALVHEPHPDDAIIAVLKQLAGVLAGDPAVCDLARVMRLPGTHNTKDGSWRRCTLLDCSDFDLRYEFSDLVEMLDVQRPLLVSAAAASTALAPVDPFLALARLSSFKPSVDVEARLRAMSYLAPGETGIHATQLSVTASLAAQGVDADEIVSAVLCATEAAAGNAGVSWNWKREEAAIRAMVRSAAIKFAPREVRAEPVRAVTQLRVIDGGGVPKPETFPAAIVRNDRGNAQILIEEHGDDMRYVLGIGWHIWDGRRYCHDPEQVEIARLAHQVHEKLLTGANDAKALKWAIQCGNSARLKNMAHEARSYVYSENADLDANPFLLNCLNGTLSLRTGVLRSHMQSDLITKLIAVDYDERAACPVWDAFLLSIFGGDADLVDFLQRCVGYSLTGDCREQVIFILHGLGSNGKSVLIETLSALLGDYVRHCPSDTFLSKQNGGIPNDLAALVGARFVSVVETEHGRGLAEGLVKQATGGDAMTVRFLHKEFFSFIPKFKLWLATNHKPVIRGSDLAIWRRIRLLPFNETFVDVDKVIDGQHAKDPDLRAKLLDELPGILAWAVRGCFEWQTRGLVVPKAVEKATKLYQESQNPIAKFISEVCWVNSSCNCEVSKLYDAYQFWCADLEEDTINKKRFGETLDERGLSSYKGTHGARMRQGIDIQEEYKKTIAEAREKAAETKGGAGGAGGAVSYSA
jgi:P4 family phage/plasmid primase-like protien